MKKQKTSNQKNEYYPSSSFDKKRNSATSLLHHHHDDRDDDREGGDDDARSVHRHPKTYHSDVTVTVPIDGDSNIVDNDRGRSRSHEQQRQQHERISSPTTTTTTITTPDTSPSPIVRVYFYRWFQLFMFSLLSFSNAWIWISVAPVATLVQRFYGVQSSLVNLLSTIYMFVFIVGNPFSSLVLDRFGLRVTLLVGASLNMIGSWIRVAGSNHASYFALLFLGQLCCALAQCFTLHIPPLLAAYWFSPRERSIATSVGAVCNQLGVSVGFLVTVLLVNEANYKSRLAVVAVVCASVSSLAGVLLLVFFREKPPSPPSMSQVHHPLLGTSEQRQQQQIQQEDSSSPLSPPPSSSLIVTEDQEEQDNEHVDDGDNDDNDRDDDENDNRVTLGVTPPTKTRSNRNRNISSLLAVLSSAKSVLTNVHYLNLLLGFGVSQGCYYALSTLLDQLVEPFGYGTSVAGTLGFILTLSGILGALFAGFIADRTQYHRALLRLCFLMSSVSIIALTIVLQRRNMFYVLCVTSGIFGFFITSVLPLAFELSVECTFEADRSSDVEALSGGFLMASAQVFGIVFTMVMDALTHRGYIKLAEWLVAGVLCASAMLVSVGYHGKLKRLEYERLAAKSIE